MNATSMRQSIAAKTKEATKADPRRTVIQRQRHLSFDRFLARVFMKAPDSWVLKGGAALMARIETARHSDDIDLAYLDGDIDCGVAALREISAYDLGDHFRFEISDPNKLIEGNIQGYRVPAVAYIGTHRFQNFHIDLVSNATQLPVAPDWIGPMTPINNPGYQLVSYRGWPLVNHVADKLAACLEHYGAARLPSSRYRDLADLYLIAVHFDLNGSDLHSAVHAELNRRCLPVPDSFQVPDERTWRQGWKNKLAPSTACLRHVSFDDAVETVQQMLAPALGMNILPSDWHHDTRSWVLSPMLVG